MNTTLTLAANLGCTIFDLYDQDIAEVIMTINYYIALGDKKEAQSNTPQRFNEPKRVKVNDATATGGWF